MLKQNNLKLGLVLGLLLPLIVFVVIYLIRFSYLSFGEFFNTFLNESRLVTFFSAWCLLANIALFTIFINTNRYQTAKGVFATTVFYGLGFLLLKILI